MSNFSARITTNDLTTIFVYSFNEFTRTVSQLKAIGHTPKQIITVRDGYTVDHGNTWKVA